MRADRLLSILLLLQVHRSITARELAQRLEVSERTIHRDMESLSMAGIPVVAVRGIGGGWALLEEYRTNLTGLNEAEIQALFLSRPAQLLSDLGLHRAADAALIKLLAALPVIARQGADYARQRIYIDAAGWHRSDENISCLPVLQEAVWQERKLKLSYRRSDDTVVERLVDPLGLVAKGSTWYLIAAVDGEARTYRVARVQHASLTEEVSTRPDGFDLATYWEQSSAHFVANLPRFPVVVRVAPEVLPVIAQAGRYAQILHVAAADVKDGWIKVHLQFETQAAACGYLLSFGVQVEIVEPESLRALVRQLAESVAAYYAVGTDR